MSLYSRSRRSVNWYLGIALTVTAIGGILHLLVAPRTGLVRTVYSELGFAGEPLVQDLTTEVNLAFLDEDPTLPQRLISVDWSGFWFFPRPQTVDVFAGADDRVDILVDGELVLRRNPNVGMHTIGESVALSAGAHQINVRYEQDRGAASLNVQYGVAGKDPGALVPTQLFPSRPRIEDFLLATLTYCLTRFAAVLWLIPTAALILVVVGRAGARAMNHLRTPRVVLWIGRAALDTWRTCAGVFEAATAVPAVHALHIFALSALGVAHPLLDVVAREPEFFVARNTTTTDLLTLVGLFCIALPATLVAIESACAKLNATASVVHGMILTILGGVLLLPPLNRAGVLGAAPSIALAFLIAAAAALLYRRSGGVRTFVTALTPAVIVVPAAFLLNDNVWEAVVRTDALFSPARVTSTPPIVFIVFDEFPVTSLLDQNREIDRVRYPNFARLADGATWYRNASTVSSQTVWAVPAIVSGKYPVEPNAVPTRRYFPNNLFTMLSESYRMTVFGRFLQLCPANTCEYDLEVHDSLGALAADLGVVYLHIISPDTLAAYLPPILVDWRDFATRRRFREDDGERRRNDRISEFDRFLETITVDSEGRLYFLHSLTPHMRFEFVPSGHRYDAPSYQRHREGGAGLFLKTDPWLPAVVQQRHLLQVGFVDRLIGRLVDRLEALGIYDEALIVVTADHGTSFQHEMPRRGLTEGTRADVMMVPLIVKLPGQVTGSISDENVETVDIVPTIASVLSTTLPYGVDGRSLLDSPRTTTVKTFVQRNATRVRVEQHDLHPDDRFVTLDQKLFRFESGLYGLGPRASLVGLPLSTLEVDTDTETSVRLDDPQQFDNVDLRSHTLPLYVRGTMTNGQAGRVSLAIAVNGAIVATTQSYQEHGEWVFSSMIPEAALAPGANDLQVFIVDHVAEDNSQN